MTVILNGRSMTDAEYAVYREAHDEENASRLREMFDSGDSPYGVTDSTYMKGHANGSQFQNCPHIGDAYAETAKKAGMNIKGKRYLSGLAAYPGDPKAWVNGRGDIQKVCEERDWNCTGTVNHKSRGIRGTPKESPALASDIVDRKVAEIVASQPSEKRAYVDVDDLREQVVERHGRKKKVN